MPRPYQIIPKNSFPTEEVYVNDNTVVVNSFLDVATNVISFLYVVSSPKGKDGVVQTISGQQEFVDKIGIGPYSLYGQSLLSAYSVAASGNAAVHVLRVAASDATYANVTVCARYQTVPGAGLIVTFVTHGANDALSGEESNLTDIGALENAYTAPEGVIEGNWTEVKLFTVAAYGRGAYGNNYQIKLSPLRTQDKQTTFKNYQLEVFEAGLTIDQKEAFRVCFGEDALVGETSYFADAVICDPETGSEYLKFVSFPEGFQQIVDAYNAEIVKINGETGSTVPTQTVATMDFFGGLDRDTNKKYDYYLIDTDVADTISLYGKDGYPSVILGGGDDGSLSASANKADREALIEQLFIDGYSGKIDPFIKSKNKFPTAIIPDCGFSQTIKNEIHALNMARTDSVALFDMGLDITEVGGVLEAARNFVSFVDTYEAIDAYCGKIRDPYNKKIITVTSTYALCLLYAAHFNAMGGKHIPLADNAYGNLEDVFIPNTVYPVFDEDIHADLMNELIDERINFARANARMEIKRATQTTRQPQLSMLSELHNVFILKDVKRAMEQLTASNRYNFAEANDIVRFNTAAENVCAKFSGQVVSITAQYAQTQWEKEMSIIHLYVTIVNKNIVKTTIIEIDVNRA